MFLQLRTASLDWLCTTKLLSFHSGFWLKCAFSCQFIVFIASWLVFLQIGAGEVVNTVSQQIVWDHMDKNDACGLWNQNSFVLHRAKTSCSSSVTRQMWNIYFVPQRQIFPWNLNLYCYYVFLCLHRENWQRCFGFFLRRVM